VNTGPADGIVVRLNLRTHYRLNRWTWLGAGVFSLFALIGIAGLVDGNGLGDKIFGAVLALVGAFFATRQARAGVVIATSEGLIVRQLIRTYRVPLTRIERVTDEVRPRGPMAYRRCCLTIEFEDGTRKVYGDLNSAPSKRGRPATAAKVAGRA
jgi:hypothetical protein